MSVHPYVSPSWLTNGHLQTIVPAKLLAIPKVVFRRERWICPDEDFIDLDFIDAPPNQPLVVLFHGLEGSSESHYARALMTVKPCLQKSQTATTTDALIPCSGVSISSQRKSSLAGISRR